jgi:hypothetical protein
MTQPAFERRGARNWLTLFKCAACGQLWVGVPYEPYASFLYQVLWNGSETDWSKQVEQDDGRAVVERAEGHIKATWRQLGPEDQAAIEHHRLRSYGRNPIDS